MLEIESTSRRFSFKIKLESRYTVIIDDSATGKTQMVRMMTENPDWVKYSDRRYDSIYLGSSRRIDRLADLETGRYVFIVDDDDTEESDMMRVLMRETKNSYFLLITRNTGVPWLNYGVRDVYRLSTVNKVHVLMRFNLPEPAKLQSAAFISEDSKSGLQFYKQLYSSIFPIQNRNGNVSGKDYLCLMLNEMKDYSKFVLLVDWCSFGNNISELCNLIELKNLSVSYDSSIDSFEYLLLQIAVKDNVYVNDLEYPSKEKMYEEILSKLGVLSHGRNLPEEILTHALQLVRNSEYKSLLDWREVNALPLPWRN